MVEDHANGDVPLPALSPLREDVGNRDIERHEGAIVEKATESEPDDHFGNGHNADGLSRALERVIGEGSSVTQDREAIRAGLPGTVRQMIEDIR